MKTQCSGKTGFMALKLDMSKAYDRVEWVFLEKILLKMGFQDTWVAMIMQCITTMSYSILVKACFNHIKEQIWTKMQGWKEKLLSQAGKEIMIKAVVQLIPMYSMNVFQLPIGLLKDIEAIIRKFWWGCSKNSRKIHWVKWETLCSSKSIGGIGFHDLRMFNDAMLGKQVWRLFHDRTSLVYKVFRAKYFTSGNIFDAVVSPRCSFAWQSILQSRERVLRGAQWRVGDG